MKGFTSQAKELGLSSGTLGWLQEVNRGFHALERLPWLWVEVGLEAGHWRQGDPHPKEAVARRKGSDGVKEGTGAVGGPELDQGW